MSEEREAVVWKLESVKKERYNLLHELNQLEFRASIVRDYMETLDRQIDDLEERLAVLLYKEWKRDPSSGRPYDEFRAELVEEGLLPRKEA